MGLFDGWNRQPDDDNTDPAYFRDDAGTWMTDDQYKAWLNGS